jgi:hypothetical protein
MAIRSLDFCGFAGGLRGHFEGGRRIIPRLPFCPPKGGPFGAPYEPPGVAKMKAGVIVARLNIEDWLRALSRGETGVYNFLTLILHHRLR